MTALSQKVSPRPGLLHDEPMSRHTSWRIGGPADFFYKPRSLDDLQQFLAELDQSVPVHWVGLGSNLLVRDGGIRGVVIATIGLFNTIERTADLRVRAGSGAACTRIARRCVQWGIGPAEFFAGIPGTIGGALTMNAGAFGGETWQRVVSVETISRRGLTKERTPEDYEVSYRSVHGPADEWFIGATFEFEPGYETDAVKLKETLARRKLSQPIGLPSCGSVFRNPAGDHAARLIEAAGLKGFRIGGAEVSTKHANFIINAGGATALDVEAVLEHVHDTVEREHGIDLLPEVRIVGEVVV